MFLLWIRVVFLSLIYKICYDVSWVEKGHQYSIIFDKFDEMKDYRARLKVRGIECKIELMKFAK